MVDAVQDGQSSETQDFFDADIAGFGASTARPTHHRKGTSDFLPVDDASGDAGIARVDLVFSASEQGQHFAHETPDISFDQEAVQDDSEIPSSLNYNAIRRFGLDKEDFHFALQDLDLASLRQLFAPCPLLNALYVSASGFHKVAQAEGPISADLDPELVRALIDHIEQQQSGSQVIEISDVHRFAQDRSFPSDAVPSEVKYFAGAVLKLPPEEGAQDVAVALVSLFDSSAEHASRHRIMVETLARLTQTSFRQAHLVRCRDREAQARGAIISINRLTHDLTDHSRVDSSRFGRILVQAARSVRDVLDASSVAILDITGFKFEESGTEKIQVAAGIATEHVTPQSPPINVTKAAPRTPSPPKKPAGRPTPQGSSSSKASPSPPRSSDTTSGSPGASSSSTVTSSRDSDSSHRPSGFGPCLYTKSQRPVPVKVRSGAYKDHFDNLTGDAIRPAIAKFLARANASSGGTCSITQTTKEAFLCHRSAGKHLTLDALVPTEVNAFIALPLLDASHQPLYLMLISFQDVDPALEPSDLLFLEQLGGAVTAGHIRVKSRAIDTAQERISARMQHILRTPLHNIIGSCETVQSDSTDTALATDIKRMLANVALSSESLGGSIDDLLDYAAMAALREPAASSPASWAETSLESLLEVLSRTAVAAWRVHCLSKTSIDEDRHQVPPPPELMVTCGKGGWTMPPDTFRFDVEGFSRIVSKVTTNALQATSEGSVTVNLSIGNLDGSTEASTSLSERSSVNELVLSVSDTGSGMDQEFMEKHLWRSLDQVLRHSAQHGLGLTMCSAIMSRLGGRITVRSAVDQGSRFQFFFPFSGPQGASCPPTAIKVAAIPTTKGEKSQEAFVRFCRETCKQFGATLLGDAAQEPELLDHADLLLMAGEGCETDEGKESISSLVLSRQTRNEKALTVVLPNRAYVDPPSSLKPERKKIWIGQLPALEFYRPFVVPDLHAIRDVFDDLAAGREVLPSDHTAAASDESATQNAEQDQATAEDPPANTVEGTAPFRLLVLAVDDDIVTLKVACRGLDLEHVEYITASNGQEAVDLYRKHLPQVVILDINMPVLDGFQTAVAIRQTETTNVPRIIAITALSMEKDKILGARCGIDEWFPKPQRMRPLAKDIKASGNEGVWNHVPRHPFDPPPPSELGHCVVRRAGEAKRAPLSKSK